MKEQQSKVRSTDKKIQADSLGNFPIVGIGASAGGLEALEKFFEKMPAGNNIAFVIIQHLDPNHKAMLPELLQRSTILKVVEVTDRLKVKPDHIYVIPPNKSMSIMNRTLYLFDPVETHGLRLPIDFFFSSLADELKEKSIGIILSGMGSDGSIGLRAIKDKVGLVLVQDPESAKFDGMPSSAIKAVQPHIILPPEQLPERLLSFLNCNSALSSGQEINIKDISSFEKIILLLRTHKGNDFSLYKKNTLVRRINRRLEIHRIKTLRSYLHFLQTTPGELDILFKELLIGVTNFFRDPIIWEKLKEEILPELLRRKSEGTIIRAWVPACATGEDAYSLAIIFSELLQTTGSRKDTTLQIFATDINIDSIDKARKGSFSKTIALDVSKERLGKFFSVYSNGYRISQNIREMIVFAPQNIIKDPPFTRLDILICRNLLIYFSSELQKRVLSVFHYSLNTDGFLMLGNEESVNAHPPLFKKANNKLRIYTRIDESEIKGKFILQLPSTHKSTNVNESTIQVKTTENLQGLTDNLLLNQYAPASVLVNRNGEILYITGRTGKYLEPAAGKANMNIFNMLREDLNIEFTAGFKKAVESYDKIILSDITVKTDGLTHITDIIIQQIEKPAALKGFIIIVFKDVKVSSKSKPKSSKRDDLKPIGLILEADQEVINLKESLKNTLEAIQVSEEELKSANEELQSTNEELQSTNEELTSSKEEMQSMNEELQTVNAELMSKVDEFTNTNNDLKNLLESTEIATLFLDKKLTIRRFTNLVSEIFRLVSSDVGRPIKDFSTELVYPEILSDSLKVLKTLIIIEKEIMTRSKNWFKIRIMPYRTTDDMIDGLVITFSDISRAKRLEMELNETIQRLRSKKDQK